MDRKFTEELRDKHGEMSSIYQGIANYSNNKEPFFTCCFMCVYVYLFLLIVPDIFCKPIAYVLLLMIQLVKNVGK